MPTPPTPGSGREDLPSEEQFAIWRKMTMEEKYNLFMQHMHNVRELKRAGIRMIHPDWTEEQVEEELRTIYKRGVT